VDPETLRTFHDCHVQRLLRARIHAVRCNAAGLTLGLERQRQRFELGLAGGRGVAWAWLLPAGARADLLAATRDDEPSLGDVVLPWLDWPDAVCLDALRAWLLRPVAKPPVWLGLEGYEIAAVRVRPGDRVLEIGLESQDSAGRLDQRTLRAELFGRGMNLMLVDAAGSVLANWSGRRPAPSVDAPALPPATPAQPAGELAARAAIELARAAAVDLMATRERQQTRHRKRLQHLVKGLERDHARALEGAAVRQRAELLSANLYRVKRGDRSVRVDDLYAGGTPLEIELDPRLSPQENVAELFKRARRGERGLQTVAARLQQARAELDATLAPAPTAGAPQHPSWRDALAAAAATFTAEVPATLRVSPTALWAPAGPAVQPRPADAPSRGRTQAQDTGPGRRFALPGGWEVRVGRSNAENDELTHGFAHPDDVWLHASGVAGSHVVLRMHGRRDNPPSDILEIAAGIAARFSKAKHAGTVPVIWTRKRFVRKPRGAKPGLAVCTQEKTVFVEPGLPEQDG
jgi:hypothetical protein